MTKEEQQQQDWRSALDETIQIEQIERLVRRKDFILACGVGDLKLFFEELEEEFWKTRTADKEKDKDIDKPYGRDRGQRPRIRILSQQEVLKRPERK